MARKKKQDKPERAQWKGFHNFYLSDKDKQEIKDNELDETGLVSFIERCVQEGYKVSVSFTGEPGFYTCTAYGSITSCANPGYAVSARHADLGVGLSALAWIMESHYQYGPFDETEVNNVHDW